MAPMHAMWGAFLLLSFAPGIRAGLTCSSNKWLDNSKSCCIDSGLCSSSSCTVFGFKNSARTNCHTADTNPNCKNSYCSWAGSPTTCVPTAGRQNHCYGTVKCTDGSNLCDGYGSKCLDDGVSNNFKICGDDSCPTNLDGTCACPCGKERNETLGDCVDIPYGPRRPCCGGCGPGAVCHNGVCECECGKKNTVGTIDDGCEDKDTVCCPGNPICGPNAYCENGQCYCKCGFTDTNGDLNAGAGTNGCETPVNNVCCGGCPPERVCRGGQCVCPNGLLEPDCKPPVECKITAVANKTGLALAVDSSPQAIMLWRPGPEVQKGKGKGSNKGVDLAVGEFSISYVESSSTFTLTYNLNNLEAWGYPTSYLRFKKVWPRLRFRKPTQFDSKWLRDYVVASNATYLRFEGIQVPDFVCDVPGPKDMYLWTQMQFWVPNHGTKLGSDGLPLDPSNVKFRAAHGYLQDGLSKTGRQRREYVVPVMCGGNVDYITSGDCTCNPACTKANEYCDIHTGQPTCECQEGYQRDPVTGECLPDSCSDLADFCPENSYCQERGVGNGPICKCNPSYHPTTAPDGSLLCVRKCVFNGATGLKAVGTGGIIGKLGFEINDNATLDNPEFAFSWTLTDGQVRRISAHITKEQWMSKHVPLMYSIQSILATGAGTYRYPPVGYIQLNQGPIDCSPSADNTFYIASQLGYVTSTGASGKGHNRGRKTGMEESMSFEFRVKCLPVAQCPGAEKCHNCHNLAECVWDTTLAEDNKYKCKCAAGYKGTAIVGSSTDGCFDENECSDGNAAACGANAVCTNTAGSYTCACSAGKFTEDPKGGCCSSGSAGCPTTMTPRDAISTTPVANSDSAAQPESCSIAPWVWITLGVLATALVVVSCALIVQRVMFRQEVPFIQVAGAGHQSESAPAPSVASNFQHSPSVRHRVTPSGRAVESKSSYNPIDE